MAGRIRRSALDGVDRALVAALRQDGRASNVELARRIGVSEKTVRARVARLVDEHGLTVTVELAGTGRRSQMVYLVETEPGQRLAVAQALADRDEATKVHLVTGAADVLLAASFPNDAEALRFQQDTLATHPGVRQTRACHLIHQVGGPDRGESLPGPVVDTGKLAELMIAPRPHGGFDELAERICDIVTAGLGADRALITTERPGGTNRTPLTTEPGGAGQRADTVRPDIIGHQPVAPAKRRGISERYLRALTERIRDGRIDGPVKRVWETRQHVLVADARADPLMAAARDLVLDEGYVTLLNLPVPYGSSLIATVSTYYDHPVTLSDEYIATAQAVIDQFAVGLARALGLAPPAPSP